MKRRVIYAIDGYRATSREVRAILRVSNFSLRSIKRQAFNGNTAFGIDIDGHCIAMFI